MDICLIHIALPTVLSNPERLWQSNRKNQFTPYVRVFRDRIEDGAYLHSKVLPKCTLPLTGARVVNKIVTELAMIEVTPQGLVLRERAPGVSVEEIRRATAAKLIIPDEVPEMNFGSQARPRREPAGDYDVRSSQDHRVPA